MGKFIDMTDTYLYDWHIIKKDEESNTKEIKWICQCQLCGRIKSVRGADIRKGKSTNCGCKRIENLIQRNKENALDLTDKIFGYLQCISPTEKRQAGGKVIWKCKCLKCGKEHEASTGDLLKGTVISCGCAKQSIGEFTIEEILKENNILFESQKQFENCIYEDTKRKPKFDFYVNNQYIIEYDGEQHFKCSENSFITKEKLERTQIQDKYKNTWYFKNNIPIIRIPYLLKPKDITLEDLLLETSKYLLKGEK